jgi:VWFA-related protein
MKTAVLLPVVVLVSFAQELPQFSSSVQLVMVDVQATEKGTGRIIDLLGPKDFEVYDNDVRREVKEFHYETMPLDVVFLIYGKSGVGPAKDINAFRQGLRAGVGALEKGDRAAIIRTDTASQMDLAMTADLEKVQHAIIWGGDQRHRPGHDHLYDAVRAATELFPRPRDRARRRAIVAVTDDVERGSKVGMNTLITDLLEADTTLNEIVAVFGVTGRRVGVGGVWGIPRVEHEIDSARSGKSLREAVEATGGEAVPDDLFKETFPDLVRRIRTRYLLGFYADPTPGAEYHMIEVRLTPEALGRYPNALIRARRGYYATPSGTTSR